MLPLCAVFSSGLAGLLACEGMVFMNRKLINGLSAAAAGIALVASGLLSAGAVGAAPSAHHGATDRPRASAAVGTWKLLPAAPVKKSPIDQVSVWTGREMIIHGGGFGQPEVTFAYRPASGTWARLRPGPKPLTLEADDVAVWTGSRMLVMGLTNGAYNPAANTWRAIAPLIMPDEAAVLAWTGSQVIDWGGVCCSGTSNWGASYNPKTNRWRALPVAPLTPRRSAAGAWTGHELIVAGGGSFDNFGHITLFRNGAAYNPATRKWRAIAPMPTGRWGAASVWDGKELLVIGGSSGKSGSDKTWLVTRGLAYYPKTNHWRWLPKMTYPRFGFAAVWTGRQVLIWGGVTSAEVPPPHGEIFTPATGKWTAMPMSPLRGRTWPLAVWTGRQLIVWGW